VREKKKNLIRTDSVRFQIDNPLKIGYIYNITSKGAYMKNLFTISISPLHIGYVEQRRVFRPSPVKKRVGYKYVYVWSTAWGQPHGFMDATPECDAELERLRAEPLERCMQAIAKAKGKIYNVISAYQSREFATAKGCYHDLNQWYLSLCSVARPDHHIVKFRNHDKFIQSFRAKKNKKSFKKVS
jgi:hypothetical protein